MKYMMNIIALFVSMWMSNSCTKISANDGVVPNAPANLAVTATVSNDGSGKVNFTATADNAVSYFFDLGTGDVITNTTGQASYQYKTNGTNTYNVTVTAKSSAGVGAQKTIQILVSVNTGSSDVFWSDEFNTNGAPDATKWTYDLGNNNGWGNNELQFYTNRPQNVIVENGVLKINAIRENYNGFGFTSARILSKGKFAFTYGRVEARVKLPAGVGTWPAVWMLGKNIDNVGWPNCGEIDIMEHRGSELNKIFGTLHYPGRFGDNADGSTRMISNATTEFHVYSVEWNNATIKIFVDGQLFHTVNNSANLPFNQDFFLLMNLAIGGNFAGPVDPSLNGGTMEVDYIRVYK
jgi:beta-glucanase (GH16 family)